MIQNMTPEQRAAALAQAKIARQQKQAEREANKAWLKTHYLDMSLWQSLASKYKVRMPMEGEATTVSTIRKYLKKASISVEQWNDHYTSMKYFVQNNPNWSAQATLGLILELKEDL